MTAIRAIEETMRQAGIDASIEKVEPLSGGCIHNAARLTLDDGRRLAAKSASAGTLAQFREEARGLSALHDTGTVVVPKPLGCAAFGDTAVLLMSYIESGRASATSWGRLGSDLAALHSAHQAMRYGFEIDNHLGSTPQPNGWLDDWVSFNQERRIGHQLRLLEEKRALSSADVISIERLIDRLDDFLPRHPSPALLHGDLWSGNALPTIGDRIAIIDPAPSIGDCWADIAMMKLFGGFARETFDAYETETEDREGVEERIAVYQLYHLLNHVYIFGQGYIGQSMAIVRRLVG